MADLDWSTGSGFLEIRNPEDNPDVLRAQLQQCQEMNRVLGKVLEEAYKREEFMMDMIKRLGDALFKQLPERL